MSERNGAVEAGSVDGTYDIAVIGGGPGGYVAAAYAAKKGAKVVLVEKDTPGGTCLNRGCIPTKALIRTAEVYKTLQEAGRYGCRAEKVEVDFKKAMARKDRVVKGLVKGVEALLARRGVTVIRGWGRLMDGETVVVSYGDGRESLLKARHIILATGSEPVTLSIPGASSEAVIDSTQALELDALPESMIVIGGGVIGMEFAFIFTRLGAKVTVIEYMDQILPSVDEDLAQEVFRSARTAGIQIFTKARATAITPTDAGLAVALEDAATGQQLPEIAAEKVLMAVGRRPLIEGLGVVEVGIELDPMTRGIKVNERMQTNIDSIYAIGDVTGKVMLAHAASHQGLVAVDNILGQESRMDYSAVPNAIFTDPEIASVGVTEKEAAARNLNIRVGRFPFAANGKASTLGTSRGFVKLIADADTGRIIGGGVVGPGATDLIAEITLAVQHRLTVEQVARTIHAHPTLPEAIFEAAWAAESGALHLAD